MFGMVSRGEHTEACDAVGPSSVTSFNSPWMSLSDSPLLLRNSALRSGVVFWTWASWRNFLACSRASSRDVLCSAADSATDSAVC